MCTLSLHRQLIFQEDSVTGYTTYYNDLMIHFEVERAILQQEAAKAQVNAMISAVYSSISSPLSSSLSLSLPSATSKDSRSIS